MSSHHPLSNTIRVAAVVMLLGNVRLFRSCTQTNASPADTDEFGGVIGTTFEESTEWWPEKERAPEGAPKTHHHYPRVAAR